MPVTEHSDSDLTNVISLHTHRPVTRTYPAPERYGDPMGALVIYAAGVLLGALVMAVL